MTTDVRLTPPSPALTSPPPRRSVRALASLIWLVLVLALGEASARVFWHAKNGLGVFSTRDDVVAFYPELRRALKAVPSSRDSIIDVLMLGASTIHRNHGAIEQVLEERLTLATGHKVRIFNLGTLAHTSRDSYYKYRALATVTFDLVILYDGFNEVRANNVPPELFRDDYSHYGYYALANDVLDGHRLRPFALPYTVYYLVDRVRERLAAGRGRPHRVPKDQPDSEWTAFGSTVRTVVPFRRNAEAVLDMAASRGDPVLLMTMAAYFAPGYTEAAFRARGLDYALHAYPIELWGRPENVAKGIAAHQAVIRALHEARPEVGFVDLATAMPPGRTYWNDVCHVTIPGSERFVDALLPAALAALRPRFTLPDSPTRR